MVISSSRDSAVIISTCDNYSDIWDPFFTLFIKFWPDNPYPVFINSETLECHNENVVSTTLKARSMGLSWTRRLKEALERINADYIVFFLDDFFLYDYVDTVRIEKCISYMREDTNIAAIYITCLSGQMKMEECRLPGLEKCSHTGKSKVNITLTIWRKSAFEYYLNHDESAWEFEANAYERSLERTDTFYSFSRNSPIAIPYSFTKYGLFAGKWFKETADLFREHGITHDFSIRGFYQEYEFGLIPYVTRQIKMDSYLVPCYSLTHDNPRIDIAQIVEEGHFTQVYDVVGARNAAIWYPSASYYGHVIENFKCTVVFKSGVTEILRSGDVFGSFSMFHSAMCFLRPGVCVYILLKSKQEILQITIEGSLNKRMSRDDLAAAYDMNVRVAPTGFKGLFDRSRTYAEILLIPETFTSFRIYSRLCFKYYDKYDEELALLDGKDRFPGHFLQAYKIDKTANNIVRWDVGGIFGGYAIEELSVELIFNGTSCQLEAQHIKGDGVPLDKYWVLFSPTAYFLFTLPEVLPDEIRISGNIMAPMPRSVLRAVIYADVLANENDEACVNNEAKQGVSEIEENKKNWYRNRQKSLDRLRFVMSLAKRGIKKYGVFGTVKEVFRRLFCL